MTDVFITNLLHQALADRWVLLAVLAVSVAALVWIARRVRKLAASERPDEPLSTVAMLVGLGWSSEAIWELTQRLGWGLELRIPLFTVLELLLGLAMIRAKRNMREHGHPGRSGRTAWIVASGMALVAASASQSVPEAFLRLLIPLLVTNQWWDGLVGEGGVRQAGPSSWRWTPRRLLLAVGAIEPGERDIETVHRERLTQQMTRLLFKARHGAPGRVKRHEDKLMRLSVVADDAIKAAVLDRVTGATWFKQTPAGPSPTPARPGVPAGRAAAERARRVIHRRSLRILRVKHPRPVIPAAPPADPDPRSKQEIEDAIRFLGTAEGAPSQRQIAHLLRTSQATVNRVLRRTRNPVAHVNGNRPEL